MGSVLAIITIVFVSVTVTTLGSIWMGTSYSAKKHGFAQGATKRELEQIQREIAQMQKNIADLKEQIADLIIVTKDAT